MVEKKLYKLSAFYEMRYKTCPLKIDLILIWVRAAPAGLLINQIFVCTGAKFCSITIFYTI